MSLADTEFRTVLEDARARHAAVVALIYATDTQGIGLLRLYVTLGIACASGTAAGLGPTPLFERPLAWAFAAAAITVVVGAGFCLRCLRATRVNLPGRDADFWLWAIKSEVGRPDILIRYLENLSDKGAANLDRNAYSADALKWAKRCGIAAPVVALVVGAAAHYLGL